MSIAYKNENRGKLLVAVMALAIMLAGAAVILGSDSADAATQSESAFLEDIKDGSYSVNGDTEVVLTDGITATNITSGNALNITGNGILSISMVCDKNGDVMFNGVDITVGDGVTLKLSISATGTLTNCHLLMNLSMTVDGNVVLTQGENIQGQAWWNQSTETLTVNNGASFVIDGANGFSGVSATINGDFDVKKTTTKSAMNFSTVTIGETGSFDISEKNAFIQFSGDATINGTVNAPASDINVYGNLENNGVLSTGGKVTIENGKSLTNNGVLTISADGSVENSGTFENSNDGRINLYGTIENAGSGTTTNKGNIAVLGATAEYPSDMTGTGSVDTSSVMKDATLSGDLETSTSFGPNQTVTVTGNLNLLKNTILTIQGKLVIPENVTVTIEDGAQLIIDGQSAVVENNGTILVQSKTAAETTQTDKGGLVINGGAFTNNGTINAQYLPATIPASDATIITVSENAKLVNNGQFIVGLDSALNVKGAFTNAADATLSVSGTISGTVDNAGTVDISGVAADTDGVTVNLTASDAVVNINAVTGKVTVTDDGFKSPTKKEFANVGDKDSVVVNGATGFTAGGIVVKAIAYTPAGDEKNTYKGLDISGTLAVAATSRTANATSSSLSVSGKNLFVSGELSFGAGTTVDLGAETGDNVITVSGTMNITAASGTDGTPSFTLKATNEVQIYVTGEISSLAPLHQDINNVKMNAAMYTTVANAITTYHYTTLEAAVPAVADASVKNVDVYGTITVNESMDIPAGVTVRLNNGSTMNVAESADITVADGARINRMTATIDVSGSLYVAVQRTGITGTGDVKSQVVSTDGTDVLYTNLVDAMAAAESGDVIKLNNKPVSIVNTSFTIKDGVTVDTNGQAFSVYGSTFVIDGTLFISNGTGYTVDKLQNVTYDQPSTVTLNGFIKSDSEFTYTEDQDEFPAGAYYETLEGGISYWYVTTVANAAERINDASEDTVTIMGKVSMGTVSFTGVADYPAHVVIAENAEVTSGSITLSEADLTVRNGAQFTATVSGADGSVDVKMVDKKVDTTATPAGTATFSVIADEDSPLALTVTANASGAVMTFDGDVTLGAGSFGKGTVTGNVTVDGSNPTATFSTLFVEGTVDVLSGTLSVTGDAFVTGTVNAAVPSAESTDAGRASFKDLYVGISKDDENRLTAADAGTITGNAGATIAYVSAESTVPENMTSGDGMLSTQFYVDDSLWMTAYTASSDNKAKVPNAPVTDAEFIGWNDAEGVQAYAAGEDITVGSNNGKLYADINRNVYSVEIRTDGGIASVAIDDNLMTNEGGNVFSANGLTAGQHTVTYTLKSGFTGTAVLSSSDVSVSGTSFTLTGDFKQTVDNKDVTITYVLNLAGTEPTGTTIVVDGGNGDSGMGLTDYLLIVLVVLIVIMAIIVAMRLMRS